MRNLLLLLVVLCSCQSSPRSQTADADAGAMESLRAASQDMTKLFNEKNYDAYVKYVHPDLIKMMGGRDSMLGAIRKGMAEMEAGGVTAMIVAVKEPVQLIHVGKELQAVVPEDLTLHMGQREMQRVTYLLATSADDGKTWYFIEASTQSRETLKRVIPSLSDAIVFPAPSELKVKELK